MANLLKRDEFGGIERICNYPALNGGVAVKGDCYNCTHKARCNADIFERLCRYEDSGLEPEAVIAMSDNISRMVSEVCPHCGSENVMEWDVEVLGYRAFCPVCGKLMLLCDECIHSKDVLNEFISSHDWYKNINGNSQCFRCKTEERNDD